MPTDEQGPYSFADSIHVDAPPERVYDVVADVLRTGEWSVFTRRCVWDEGDGPAVGAHFTGYNSRPGRDWETRSEVVVADRGREFAWEVNSLVRWAYEMAPDGDGTLLTHRWDLPPAGRDAIRGRFGEEGLTLRTDDAHRSVPETLAAIRSVVERPAG